MENFIFCAVHFWDWMAHLFFSNEVNSFYDVYLTLENLDIQYFVMRFGTICTISKTWKTPTE